VPRLEQVVESNPHDLTVLKLHFGWLTLKMYDKGGRVLRIEVIVHHVKALHGGQRLERLSIVLARLQRMVIDFLNVVYAAHRSTLQADALDTLPLPTPRGAQRLAGVDLQKPRMRAVIEAVLAIAPKPEGFTAPDVAAKVRPLFGAWGAAYDLTKRRGKPLVARVGGDRRYPAPVPGVQILAALLILREKVIKARLGQCVYSQTRPEAQTDACVGCALCESPTRPAPDLRNAAPDGLNASANILGLVAR
jgi:hypothetical protein